MTDADALILHRRRRAVIEALKRSGPQSAQQLAESLGVTHVAVRQHLYDLEDRGIVRAVERPAARGRPKKDWELTRQAEAFFPNGHGELAASLMEELTKVFGADGLARLVRERTAKQVRAYRARLTTARSLDERVRLLAEARSEEGYMADVEAAADGALMLVENHCPICDAARACSGLCAAELECFREVLGEDVKVERTSHILAGARRCAYRITPSGARS
ncbi:MAG: metalloregulator ArsR/SmtB family transcription factor [Rhodovibrionaceae bacterium]|nr:metalloregulator ArsR/SmtB family transcription factor [Rhodovibrionaceae bacterium]